MRDPYKKQKKKIARLRGKGKFEKAIELQRKLCQLDEKRDEEWAALGDLAREAGRTELELAARFYVAKLTRASPDEWRALADRARAAGFDDDALEARFRAADMAAIQGKCQLAIELCDQVLAARPDHRPARRIRNLMAARMERLEHPEEEERKDRTITFLKSAAEVVKEQEAASSEEESVSHAELTQQQWPPVDRDRKEAEPDSVSFVCKAQSWPTVLDTGCLLFVGNCDEIGEELLELTVPASLSPETSIYRQGQPGELLYCIERGEVTAFRDRIGPEYLGTISAGSFFGEVGTIMGLPSTTSVETMGECELRYIPRDKIHKHVKDGHEGAHRLIRSLKNWYLETAIRLCPVLSTFDHDALGELIRSSPWASFRAGERLATQGESGDLQVIITGVAKVYRETTGGTALFGHQSTGDITGEIDPSPVTTVADCIVSALTLSRERIEELPAAAAAALAERRDACREALAQLDQELAST